MADLREKMEANLIKSGYGPSQVRIILDHALIGIDTEDPPKIVRETYGWMVAGGFGQMPNSQFAGLMKRLRKAAGFPEEGKNGT